MTTSMIEKPGKANSCQTNIHKYRCTYYPEKGYCLEFWTKKLMLMLTRCHKVFGKIIHNRFTTFSILWFIFMDTPNGWFEINRTNVQTQLNEKSDLTAVTETTALCKI